MRHLLSRYARDVTAALIKSTQPAAAADKPKGPARYHATSISAAAKAKRRARNKAARAARRITRKAA